MGIEPTTLGLLDPRSNQLSYEDDPLLMLWNLAAVEYLPQQKRICDEKKYPRWGSNPRPWVY